VTLCLFASDLHGRLDRYDKLFHAIETRRPSAVFLGGDLLAHMSLPAAGPHPGDFFDDFLAPHLTALRTRLKDAYPRIFAILGNDDPRVDESACRALNDRGLWSYIHGRAVDFSGHRIYGYACVPPTPFMLKDWERYDVSRYVPHGSVSPEEGRRSVDVDAHEVRYSTIKEDLDHLVGDASMHHAVLLIHTPPYETHLDRAALDEKTIDGVPLDIHVGSIAVRRFIESRQPLLTLHGHVHESARLTGSWNDRIGRTHLFTAAHDGPELALLVFDLEKLEGAERLLL
jgi:Icc-related predicted phosphoesterase